MGVTDRKQVDTRSDRYSLCCLLYELLTGRVPFSGESPVAIAYRHVREEPVPPRRIDPRVPAAFEAITLRAMARRNRVPPADLTDKGIEALYQFTDFPGFIAA